ncbi:hypothetical protein J4Q44_G00090000 [Coregonus suidteri]|uniref:Uncharacterized protein n=1 Tax=Coregonus suidteri TaxID=861788 RepID=A0AAN8R1Z7_9TELE
MLSSSIPNYLANWKIAIAVERELKERSEVRLLYQQALQKLPLCAILWKDRLLFEAAEGGKTDKLRKLVDKCQEVGKPTEILPQMRAEENVEQGVKTWGQGCHEEQDWLSHLRDGELEKEGRATGKERRQLVKRRLASSLVTEQSWCWSQSVSGVPLSMWQ